MAHETRVPSNLPDPPCGESVNLKMYVVDYEWQGVIVAFAESEAQARQMFKDDGRDIEGDWHVPQEYEIKPGFAFASRGS